MKRIDSLFQAAAVVAVVCTALDLSGVYDGFFFKMGLTILLLFIGYVLKEILKFLTQDRK